MLKFLAHYRFGSAWTLCEVVGSGQLVDRALAAPFCEVFYILEVLI